MPAKPRGGAPPGNANALKHGHYTAYNRARRAQIAAFLKSAMACAAYGKALAQYNRLVREHAKRLKLEGRLLSARARPKPLPPPPPARAPKGS